MRNIPAPLARNIVDTWCVGVVLLQANARTFDTILHTAGGPLDTLPNYIKLVKARHLFDLTFAFDMS